MVNVKKFADEFTSFNFQCNRFLLRMGLIKYFFCLNSRGSPIVVRGFLTEPHQSIVENFYSRIIENPPPDPVFRADNLNFAYLFHNQLYFVLASEESMAPSLLLELLGRLCSVVADYAGRCTELSIQKNLGLVYEIVDEVLSFGCPQATDSTNLRHLIHNIAAKSPAQAFIDDIDVLDIIKNKDYDRPLATEQSDREKSANELFFILKENLDITLDMNNQPMRTLVTGQGVCKSYLHGQPSVMLQLDPQMWFASRQMQRGLALQYDDIVFAPFVQTHSFDSDRTITFAPPEGVSNVFSYRTNRSVSPPFRITTVFENKQSKVVVVRVSIQSAYPVESIAEKIEVRFQCPVEISSASCELPPSVAGKQSSEYDSKNRQVVWKINKMAGLAEFSSRFRFMFDAGIPASPESLLGPISLKFQLTDYIPSGANVTNLVVSTTGSSSPPKRWKKMETGAISYTFHFI